MIFCLLSGREDVSDEFFSARVDIKKFVQFLMSEQVNPVKVVCNIVDDRMLVLFLVHEDITLHCFLPAVSPWRICTLFYICVPSDTIRLSLSVRTVCYLCWPPVKITGPMDTLPSTSIRNWSTPLPRMAMCVDTMHTTTTCPASWLLLKEKRSYISSSYNKTN